MQKLSAHFDELKLVIINKSLDILTVSETWLMDTNHEKGEFDIPGYTFKYRNRPQGITWAPDGADGVGSIFLTISILILGMTYMRTMEIIWLELKLPNTHPILVGSVYRHPKSPSEYSTNLSTHLDKISSEDKEVYFLGDMNTDVHIPDDYLHRKVQHLRVEQTLVQLINELTRVTAISTTGIDLIFVSNMEKVIQHGVIKTGLTDHYMPFLVRKAYIQRKAPKTIFTRNF